MTIQPEESMIISMDLILIAGLWLRQSAWDAVIGELSQSGCNAVALSLPGVDDDSTAATLDDQVATAVAAIDAAKRPVVVGHSAACTVAWMAVDQRPTEVAGVVQIGGFPAADGDMYANFFEPVDGLMPFPGWEPFEGADSADLDHEARAEIAAGMVPVLASVSQSFVRLQDERRFNVPMNLICPEYSPSQAKTWIEGGDVPELTRVEKLEYTDIDTGHWPMFTKPADLAELLTRTDWL